jgi:hypothetical protein
VAKVADVDVVGYGVPCAVLWCGVVWRGVLCDEDCFRHWPVVEHIPLLQVGEAMCCGVLCAVV